MRFCHVVPDSHVVTLVDDCGGDNNGGGGGDTLWTTTMMAIEVTSVVMKIMISEKQISLIETCQVHSHYYKYDVLNVII